MKKRVLNGTKNISGERIHQIRTTKRISQDELAAKMQINGVPIVRETISKIETGSRAVTDYELLFFAKTLDVTMDWLTGEN